MWLNFRIRMYHKEQLTNLGILDMSIGPLGLFGTS